ncbi:hypothetical protein XELAEV_18023117mg [Xenopus laevis]|uniref:Uncharacterized protein n=1 Tax=Xenopus laevis TaxID=8355 RepID=A0A974D688_XENLA|nr:hypothetical protein XELAEV_18023117mg [Xenopus laevis]
MGGDAAPHAALSKGTQHHTRCQSSGLSGSRNIILISFNSLYCLVNQPSFTYHLCIFTFGRRSCHIILG